MCLTARQLLDLLGQDYTGSNKEARLRLLQGDLKDLVKDGRIEVVNPSGKPLRYRRCGEVEEDDPYFLEYTFRQIQALLSEVVPQRQLNRLWERLLYNPDGPVLDAGRLRIVPDTLRLQPVELNPTALLAILTALANRQALDVLYENASGQRTEPRLHAQALVQRGPIPYLFALKNDETEPVRLYALHRLIRAKVVPEVPARQAEGFDLDQAIQDGQVGFGQGDSIELELRVRGYLTEVLKACPLGPGQRWEDEPNGSEFAIRVRAIVPSTGQLLRWLLGAGDNVEVIKPLDLRWVMASQAGKVARLYGQSGCGQSGCDQSGSGDGSLCRRIPGTSGQRSAVLKVCYYVPESHLESTKRAVFEAGAGRGGAYDSCCWQAIGMGQFRPLDGSQPFLGNRGELEKVAEYRVEMVCAEADIEAVMAALKEAHPYEEPAYDVVRLVDC